MVFWDDTCGLAALFAGTPGAEAAFLDHRAPVIWAAVVAIDGEGIRGRRSLDRVIDTLRADGWARLRPWDGRSNLTTFLTLLTRDIIAMDIAQGCANGFVAQSPLVWARFEAMFGRDIRRRIARRFPRDDETMREDRYQDICLALLNEDGQRLRRFRGDGGFIAYVLTVVEKLLLDIIRSEAGRRRLPVAIMRMEPFSQEIFKSLAWRGRPRDARLLWAELALRFPDADEGAVARAMAEVLPAVDKVLTHRVREISLDASEPVASGERTDNASGLVLPDPGLDPEQWLVARQQDEAWEKLVAVMADAVRTMEEHDRAYVTLLLSQSDPIAPRHCAERMGITIENLRLIQQRVHRRLAPLAKTHKNLFLSVFAPEMLDNPQMLDNA